MKNLAPIIFTVFLALLAGCAAPAPQVDTNTTVFYLETYSPGKSISVISGEADVNSSLEFALLPAIQLNKTQIRQIILP